MKLFERCPACGGALVITECRCNACQLEMRGDFQPGHFSGLADDQLAFVGVFLQARGNLTEVEKMLGISYPTIRNKLDEVNRALEQAEASAAARRAAPGEAQVANATPIEAARRAILRRVAAGELTATDALHKLRDLKGES